MRVKLELDTTEAKRQIEELVKMAEPFSDLIKRDGKEPILVWDFSEAPEELQSLSEHGGDEDWLAVVPPYFERRSTPFWLKHGSFGCAGIDEHEHPTKPGYKVYIGAHA